MKQCRLENPKISNFQKAPNIENKNIILMSTCLQSLQKSSKTAGGQGFDIPLPLTPIPYNFKYHFVG